MDTKNFNYKNKDYDLLVNKIITWLTSKKTKKDLDKKLFDDYFIKNLSITNQKKFITVLKKIDVTKIANNDVITETKKEFKEYLVSDFANYLVNYLIGYKELSLLLDAPDIEEIMVNYYDKIFIFSRDNICYKTNIVFDEKDYQLFIDYLKNTLNSDFSEREFIDGILPDQSRINIVSENVAKFNVITIRKYLQKPLTIVDLIKTGFMSVETAAYLWVAVDGLHVKPANIFICGGTSTGKTTLLSVLLDFIPSKTRIVSVEDTNEVDYTGFDNVVCLSSNISHPDSLFDITVNILRMRPDRIIIGEARGKEVKALFTAMATGHDGCISTIHANNVKELLEKLGSAPFNIEDTYLSLLNIAIVLKKVYFENKIKRFVYQISEIEKIGNLTTNDIYIKENSEPKMNFMASTFLEKICEILQISKQELKKIIDYRIAVIKELVEAEITNSKDIKEIIESNSSSYFE